MSSITYKYQPGQNVCHMMQCYMVFLHREVEGAPAYLIRRCDTGEIKDNVLESDCMDCTVDEVVEKMWPSFVYTGDNSAANQWIQENILKKIASLSQVRLSPNGDNTEYSFTCSVGTWTKAKSA